ncbi:hypothetical protein [Ruegeria sp. 6PALISEP08]|uniref:hypothetical protein n=1 Tax=Ruegeria sp. 6PALISEP08 TaxID=1225660 RepID=UPI00067EA586|nr:hypothetical protein [Ruegeria sp. 6PALISEP08]
MTPSKDTELTNLIQQAQNGHAMLCYSWDGLPRSSSARTQQLQWRTMLMQLFAEWPDTNTSIRAVSYVFTDAPFELSRFVFDAVVVWTGARFLRIEADDLPISFRSMLKDFENCMQGALSCSTGDAVQRMSQLYHHQLLTGQAYLTSETLTVMNINGKTMTSERELTPNLPYAVTVLMTGTLDEISECDPETIAPGGAFDIPNWTTSEQQYSRVSESHCKSHLPDRPRPTAEDIRDYCDLVRNRKAVSMNRQVTSYLQNSMGAHMVSGFPTS